MHFISIFVSIKLYLLRFLLYIYFILLLNTVFVFSQNTTCNCCTSEYSQFDFWIGNWEVYNKKGEILQWDSKTGEIEKYNKNMKEKRLIELLKEINKEVDKLEKEGFKVDFKFRNGFQELFIWNKESTEKYNVILPKETIKTTVVFIESYHINGYDEFATFGDSQVGGWAIKESATLYCNKGTYDLNSETFDVSYLKHESLHFTDLNNYPNLSSADLEYRSKVIELMYCTEGTIYDRISEFVSGANKANRENSHPYANYILIQNLSKLIFNSDFNSDINQWEKVSVDKINKAASSLYESSENILRKKYDLKEII